MVESLALRAWGPVGLLHMQKAAIKYKKPTRRVWNTHSMWVQHEQRWARRVAAEDQLLDRAVGATERSKTIFLLHILRDFEPTQRLDLPLGRPVPNRVGTPQDMIDPHALDQRADQSRAEFGVRHGRVGKRSTKLCVNVSDPELLRNFREISVPSDAARGLELGPGLVGQLEERTQRRVIDDEIHLRPVFGSLADVPRRCVLPYAGEGFLVIGRQQTLVDAYRCDPSFHRVVVDRIH